MNKKKIRLENVDRHLKEELKDEKFKALYELERAKVALAQKIAEIRQDKNLTQTELAKLLNVSQQFISQIETAQEKNLTIDTLSKIARILGRDIIISFRKASDKIPKLKVA